MVREPCTGQWTHQLLLDDLQGGLTSYCTRYLDISSVQLPIVTFSHQSVNLRCDLFTTSNMLVILCQASVGGCCPLYSSSPRPRPAAAPRRYWPAVSRPFGGYNQPARGHGDQHMACHHHHHPPPTAAQSLRNIILIICILPHFHQAILYIRHQATMMFELNCVCSKIILSPHCKL